MNHTNILVPQTEQRFTETVTHILHRHGFRSVPGAEAPADHGLWMEKDTHTYCVEIKYSRTRVFPTANAAAIYNRLEALWQTRRSWIPLVVAGGEISTSLRADFLEVNPRTQVLDIQNLLFMTVTDRELYDELVAHLPYSVSGLMPQSPASASTSDWNSNSNSSYRQTDPAGHLKPELPYSPGTTKTRGTGSSGFDSFSHSGIIDGDDRYTLTGNYGTGKTDILRRLAQIQKDSGELRRELSQWKGGKGTALSIQYEKLCTKVLKQLFSNDLTLWQEQAKSNDELYRFDLICKIKRDNQKDFWEMAEHYFRSKYIIFEFKNYSGTVTQMEVTTTARYLYTKALRAVAIIVSPNGFSEHADKAARGALREEGKLILPLTNAELIEMLLKQDKGEDPSDYLSDKLDQLLIDLEK